MEIGELSEAIPPKLSRKKVFLVFSSYFMSFIKISLKIDIKKNDVTAYITLHNRNIVWTCISIVMAGTALNITVEQQDIESRCYRVAYYIANFY